MRPRILSMISGLLDQQQTLWQLAVALDKV